MPPDRTVAGAVAGLRSFSTDPDLGLRQHRYQSSLRDERVAAWLGAALGSLFGICFVTGLYSHVQQHPLPWLPVPARPAGLYRVTQGLHVAAGIASVPVLLAKLWVVWPRFVAWPPFRRISDIVERLGLLALVGGGVFMVFTGVANTAQWYPWHFSFTASHYWIAWVTIGAIVAHLGAKWSITRGTFRRRHHRPALVEADHTIAGTAEPAHAGLTRRGFLGTVAAASAALTVVTIGETVPGLAPLALLAPRDPRDRPVNKSAANAGVLQSARSADYQLTVQGRGTTMRTFDIAALERLPRSRSTLPISCVEGWSYSARWSGVRLRDLLDMARAPRHAAVRVESLEAGGPYRTAFVDHFQADDPSTLLATHLDGERLSLDHGYPVRLIAPNRAGVLQTKWVTKVVVL
jgi:DMSO/TMAO reductase YedYZ molybdopterin-dependent catalytic subunit